MKNLTTLYDALFIRKIPKSLSDPRSWNSTPEAIIGFAFGKTDVPSDDEVNQSLADSIIEAVKRFPGISAYVQEEIFTHLIRLNNKNIHKITLDTKRYIDTRAVTEEALRVMGADKRTIIVAHPLHAYRSWKSCEAIGITVIGIVSTECLFDEKSIQPWTTSESRFNAREWKALIYYWLKGWI